MFVRYTHQSCFRIHPGINSERAPAVLHHATSAVAAPSAHDVKMACLYRTVCTGRKTSQYRTPIPVEHYNLCHQDCESVE